MVLELSKMKLRHVFKPLAFIICVFYVCFSIYRLLSEKEVTAFTYLNIINFILYSIFLWAIIFHWAGLYDWITERW